MQNSEKDPQYFKERAHIFKQYNALVQKRKTGVNQRNDNRVPVRPDSICGQSKRPGGLN